MMEYVAIPEERIKILKNNKKLIEKLESLVDVRIILGEEVEIEGEDPLLVMCVKQVVKAFGRGFDFDDALLLLDEEYLLEIIDIKSFAGKSHDRLAQLRGRVIGSKGKTKNIIERLADVRISVYGKTISIIGKWGAVQDAKSAIEMLLQGSKHGSVYRVLEQKTGARPR